MRRQYSEEERAAYREQQFAEMNEKVQEIAESFSRNPEDIAEYLQFSARFHRYSARNTMLIFKQNPEATFAASFKAFGDMGYHIKKGEHGVKIMVYTPVQYYRKHGGAPWRRLSDATDEERRAIKAGMYATREEAHYKIGTVFDIAQTDCPREDYPKLIGLGYDSAQHAAVYMTVSRYCEQIGLSVREADLSSAATRGYYTPDTREITVNSLLGDTQKLSTLLHEMAHGMTGHSANGTTAQREFEADALSIMFCQRFGLEITDTRREHLAECYKTYWGELSRGGDPVEVSKMFEGVNEQFRRHSERLGEALTRAGVLPQQATEPVQEGQKLSQNSILKPPAIEPVQDMEQGLDIGR